MSDLPVNSLPPGEPSSVTIAVGMSGGVDSSVAAALLVERGYRVIGLFMKNWEETGPDGVCPAERDFQDVARVCDRLSIPYYSVEFIDEYRREVFEDFLDGYRRGITPNPDVLCNREIKFKHFFNKAMELGVDYLATGHYCRVERLEGGGRLLKGLDPGKDQTYFLNAVSGEALRRVVFPIGAMLKEEVREHARRLGLATHDKKDSTGICFIGERDFRPFLQKYLRAGRGEFLTLEGERVGTHEGAVFYTLGQRRGLGLGGPGDRWYVVGKDVDSNVVYVERGSRHPALYCDELTAYGMSWIRPGAAPALPLRCRAKVRYRQPDQSCEVHDLGGGRIRVVFDRPQRAVTEGQSVALYFDDECLGGAFIETVGPSYHERGEALPQGMATM